MSSRSFGELLRRPPELGARLRLARDPDYWRGLEGSLRVAHANPEVLAAPVETSSLEADLARDGFFMAPGMLDALATSNVLRAAATVQAHGWPAVFAFMYDEPWHALRGARVHGLLQNLLGPRYRQLPRVWLHSVPVVEGARGWPPHVDYPGAGGDRLTLWLALTDATVDNGCLHVIPRHRAPELTRRFATATTLAMDEAVTLLHAAQALPVVAGSAVGWGFDLIHWGGHSTGRATSPRWAISVELLRQGASPTALELPLVEPEKGIPSFASRLLLVGLALQAFGADATREPVAHAHLKLGEALAS